MDLAGYAMRVSETRGRRFQEESHPYRSEYQRDRDRVVHTKAFRRLENKTQVFAPNYSDHFRNRLTHTIEVSQIARTISQRLRLNTDLCEVLALSHDIGHPPFGHKGERVLNEIMQAYGSGFDHNLHALFIVEDFEEKYASFRGLNLTFEVREGIVKHSHDYHPREKTYLDLSEYRLNEFPPLEAQLIDLADEIAYNSADLDDGYDSNLLTFDQVYQEVTLFRTLHQEVETRYGQVSEKLRVSETVRRLINLLVGSLIRHTENLLQSEGIDSIHDVRRFTRRIVSLDAETARLNAELKAFLHQHLYHHPILTQARNSAQNLLRTLFDFYHSEPARLPESHYRRIPRLSQHRVVCDYLAGMTDTYLQTTWEHLSSDFKTVTK